MAWQNPFKPFGRNGARPKEVLFSWRYPQPNHLLFLFPLNQDRFEESIYVLRRLERHPGGEAVQLAIPLTFKGQFPPPSHQVFFFPAFTERLSKLQTAVLLARYRYQSFDAVVNLDPVISPPMARLMDNIRAPKRIGFEGPESDRIYNIQIKTQPGGSLSAAYDQMLNLLDLGPPGDHPDYHLWG